MLIEQLGLYPSALSGHFLLQVEEVMNIPITYYMKYGLRYWRPGLKQQESRMREALEKADAA